MSGLLGKWVKRLVSMEAHIDGGAYVAHRLHFPGGSVYERTIWMDGVRRDKLSVTVGKYNFTLARADTT